MDAASGSKSTTASNARGAGSASRSTAAPSRSRTAIAPRASTSSATSIPDYEAKAKSDQGFFSKIFSSDKPVPALQYRVVVIGESTNRTVVTVLGANGTPERSPAGDRILSLLSDQLR